MDMIVVEEVPYLTDGGGQRMSCGSREHHLGSGAQDPIHRSRIRTAVRIWSPAVPVILMAAQPPASADRKKTVSPVASGVWPSPVMWSPFSTAVTGAPKSTPAAAAASATVAARTVSGPR